MTGVTSLWLPILLSAVLVFVVSSIIHMMTPWHKGDYPKVPDEDRVMEALRQPDRLLPESSSPTPHGARRFCSARSLFAPSEEIVFRPDLRGSIRPAIPGFLRLFECARFLPRGQDLDGRMIFRSSATSPPASARMRIAARPSLKSGSEIKTTTAPRPSVVANVD
jgi:hypothetical protein